MKRVALVLVGLVVIITLGYSYFKDKAGDIIPALVPPQESLSTKIKEAQHTGNTPNIPLKLPQGFEIGVFQDELTGARDLEFTDKGTLLVSQPGQGRIVALPDKNNDGAADEVITLVSDLNKPHGIAFYKGKLYIAEETRVSKYTYNETLNKSSLEKKLFDLPAGGRHTSRTIVFDKEGKMYVSLGSTCDTCVEKYPFIGTVIISDENGSTPTVYSKGLRNAVFITMDKTGNVWATEMGRDFLGDELPPDEINILTDNGDFGWPFCYGDQVWDVKFGQKSQSYCNTTIKPFYKIPAHSAPLGLTFIDSEQMPEEWQGDLLVSYHGSWNRSTPTGYKIVKVTTKGTPKEEDFISGFIEGRSALGRPVDLIFDKAGSLYISDDKGNAVYKVVKR